MSEFEVNISGLKGAVGKEEDVIRSLQNEIERLDAVISSLALNRTGFGAVAATLKKHIKYYRNQ